MEIRSIITKLTRKTLSWSLALFLFCSLIAVERGSATPLDDARIVINVPSRTLWVYLGEKIIHYYPVGLGRPGYPTPLGKYSVIRKIKEPGWENPYQPKGRSQIRPGKRNPLGSRWLGFKEYNGGEFGIHGTDNPASVGKFSSHGCVRMKVKDAEALFDMVDIGTPVEVIYEPVLIRRNGDQVNVTVYPDVLNRGKPKVKAIRQRILKKFPDAEVNDALLAEALQKAVQKPIAVGKIKSPPPGASEENLPKPAPIEDVPVEINQEPVPLPPKPPLDESTLIRQQNLITPQESRNEVPMEVVQFRKVGEEPIHNNNAPADGDFMIPHD